ncbi:Rmf/CrpP fold protein [Nocardiopsis alba]|uniref:Rmf/CrpP fold protein n=1 Tax=Nocardiopsis alba TaxID=53437 RepID=UPI0035E1D61B
MSEPTTVEPPSGADMIRAAQAGARAAAAGAEVIVCPHRPDSPVQRERALASMWLNGYNRASA